ncbi:ectoine synthase [Planktotalea arctica]|uniref:ectoine synthase n=1 Tax=Planktotalea arctica TaxID=1481893 RepID=UPI00321981B6
MIVRNLKDVEQTPHFVNYGNGTSHRLLTSADGMGFTVCHTVVKAGTESHLQYVNHLESCYCIAGAGEIETAAGQIYPIEVGTLYALNEHDRHYMRANSGADMVLVSVFSPALSGTEIHNLTSESASGY